MALILDNGTKITVDAATFASGYTFIGDSAITGHIQVTYTTKADPKLGLGHKSKARITPSGGPTPGSSTGEAWSGQKLASAKKVGEGYSLNDDDATVALQWKVTIDTAEGALTHDWTFSELPQGGANFTAQQAANYIAAMTQALANAGITDASKLSFVLTVNGTNEPVSGADVSSEANASKTYSSIVLTCTQDLDKGKTVEVESSTTGAAPAEGEGGSYTNNFQLANATGTQTGGDTITIPRPASTEPSIRKTGSEWVSYTDDLVLTWNIEVAVPSGYTGGTLTITDQLPEGLELVGLEMAPSDGFGAAQDVTDQLDDSMNGSVTLVKYSGETSSNPLAVSYDSVKRELSVSVPRGLVDEGLSKLTVTVKTRMVDGLQGDVQWHTDEDGEQMTVKSKETFVFGNTASVTWGENKSAEATHTTTVVRDWESELLSKGLVSQDGNVVSYEISINANRLDLAEDSDELEIDDLFQCYSTDALPVSASLIEKSIKVYKVNEDGTRELYGPTPYPYILKDTVRVQDEWGNDTGYLQSQFTLYVPDETALVVCYEYRLTPAEGSGGQYASSCSVKNSATIGSEWEKKSETSLTLQESEAFVWADGIRVRKTDAEDYSVSLKGATLRLSMWDGSAWSKLAEFATTSTTVNLLDVLQDLSGLQANVAYMLEEIDAPEGHEELEEPIYFAYRERGGESVAVSGPSGLEIQVLESGSILNVPNESKTVSLSVQKYWQKNNGKSTTDPYYTDHIVIRLLQGKTSNVDNAKPVKYLWLCADGAFEATQNALTGEWTKSETQLGNTAWFWSSNEMPKEDEDGNAYFYFFRELVEDTGDYELLDSDTSGAISGTTAVKWASFTNKETKNLEPSKTSITVDKRWVDESGNDVSGTMTSGSVTLNLLRKVKDTGDKVTISVTNPQSGTVLDQVSVTRGAQVKLPIDFGSHYWVKENDFFAEFRAVLASLDPSYAETSEYAFTVVFDASEDVEIPLNNGNGYLSSVSSVASQGAPGWSAVETEEVVSEGIEVQAPAWTYTWSTLPKEKLVDGDLYEYEYYVVETGTSLGTSVAGAKYGHDSEGNLVVTNSAPDLTSLQVNKQWFQTDEDGVQTDVTGKVSGSVTFEVYQSSSAPSEAPTVTVSAVGPNGAAVTVDGEVATREVPQGSIVTFDLTTENAWRDLSDSQIEQLKNVGTFITEQRPDGNAEGHYVFQCVVTEDTQLPLSPDNWASLKSLSWNIEQAESSMGEHTVTSDESWTTVVAGLPKSTTVDGVEYPFTYTVVETGFTVNGVSYVVNEDGSVTATSDSGDAVGTTAEVTTNEDGSATIKNTLPPTFVIPDSFVLPMAGGKGATTILWSGVAVLACAVAVGLHRLRHQMA